MNAFWKFVLFGILAAAPFATVTPAQTSTVKQHSDKASAIAITEIATRFATTLKKEGMIGVVKDLRRCYLSGGDTFTSLAPQEKHLIRLCMIYDGAAYSMDRGMRINMQAQFQTSMPVSEYLVDGAYEYRLNLYLKTDFPNEELGRRYLKDAVHRVLLAWPEIYHKTPWN